MLDELLLISGNDIPFLSVAVTIHQPTIREIAYIGEENFFIGCQLLDFSKEVFNEEDRNNLADTDDFEILMSIVNDERANAQQICALLVLNLIFPQFSVMFGHDGIHLDNEQESRVIDRESYPEFRSILVGMFGLNEGKKEDYNPENEAARKIAEKLKKGRAKAAAANGKDTKKIAVFSRYASILAIGLNMDLRVFLDHTVFQLYDEFKRFQLKQAFDINLKARLAGATDLDEIDNWMDDIHPQSK